MLHLLQQIIHRADAGESLAICTLVRTRGSTPQEPGAIMLVLADGQTQGTIGGGCVEAEVRSRALRLLLDKPPAATSDPSAHFLSFQLDHDLGWDDGLICGGNMDVAVQLITEPHHADAYRRAHEDLAANRPAQITLTALDEQNQPALTRTLDPPPTLIIAGAGHVGSALAAIARLTDFDVTVIDDRPDMAAPARFPDARCLTGPIDQTLAHCRIDDRTYIVIVTRGHRNDGRALAAVVNSPARYIGLIGSRRKVLALFEDLKSAGVPRQSLDRIQAPIGLDIGAVTPTEIAISIFAQLIATRRNTPTAAPLRLTPAQIDALFQAARR